MDISEGTQISLKDMPTNWRHDSSILIINVLSQSRFAI